MILRSLQKYVDDNAETLDFLLGLTCIILAGTCYFTIQLTDYMKHQQKNELQRIERNSASQALILNPERTPNKTP